MSHPISALCKLSSGADPYALELDVLNLSFLEGQRGEKEDKSLMEARFIARRIRELLDAPLMIGEGE